MRLDTTRLNDDKSFTFTFIDDSTEETKAVTLTDDEIKALNFWHKRMHHINGTIQDFELGGQD
jgi:hypothetical protein